MKQYVLIGVVLGMGSLAYGDLGIMDTASESAAKTEASGLGVTQIYDHPADAPNGQYVVPVAYNRTAAEGNGTETQAGDAKPNDVDYIPLSQLKGAQGIVGASGTQGNTGNTGAKGDQGVKGDKGDKGDPASNEGALALNLGASIRWYDWKYVNLTSGAAYDIHHFGWTVNMMAFNIKLGRSYEEREIDKLRKDILNSHLILKKTK